MPVVTFNGDLKISGYASLFGQTDMSGDIVRCGAFAASLLSRTTERLPMLFGHETAQPIGVWDRIFEDRTGLFVSGRIIGGHHNADRTARLIREGALSGLSIGYRPKRIQTREAGGRNLLELDLWEVSVVAFPMLRHARITQIDDIEIEPTSHSKNSKRSIA